MPNYNCPYCKIKTYSKYRSLISHVSKCKLNTHEYYIHREYGPIHYSEFNNKSQGAIKRKYPLLYRLSDVITTIKDKVTIDYDYWSKEDIIEEVNKYYLNTGNIPSYADLPFDHHTLLKKFDSIYDVFQLSIIPFQIFKSGKYGIMTKANDGVWYKSKLEADFVNNILMNKYTYEYSTPYPNSNRFYDFYIKELDLYIEIDGELRPEVITEKVLDNKKLGRKLLVLTKHNKSIWGNEVEKFDV